MAPKLTALCNFQKVACHLAAALEVVFWLRDVLYGTEHLSRAGQLLADPGH